MGNCLFVEIPEELATLRQTIAILQQLDVHSSPKVSCHTLLAMTLDERTQLDQQVREASQNFNQSLLQLTKSIYHFSENQHKIIQHTIQLFHAYKNFMDKLWYPIKTHFQNMKAPICSFFQTLHDSYNDYNLPLLKTNLFMIQREYVSCLRKHYQWVDETVY